MKTHIVLLDGSTGIVHMLTFPEGIDIEGDGLSDRLEVWAASIGIRLKDCDWMQTNGQIHTHHISPALSLYDQRN